MLRILLLLGSIGFATAFKPIKGLIKGAWDVFGRVPNDDFLFKTANLIDPKLLTRTFTETVLQFFHFDSTINLHGRW